MAAEENGETAEDIFDLDDDEYDMSDYYDEEYGRYCTVKILKFWKILVFFSGLSVKNHLSVKISPAVFVSDLLCFNM